MSTDADWEAYAKKSPYWAVLSEDRFRDENLNADAKKIFFESGEEEIRAGLAVLKHVFQGPDRFGTALDFGCWVGRLLLPLARRSQRAVGVDVSETMLRVCAENARAAQLTNIALVKGDDALSRVHQPFDLLSSSIVFQHIPVERGLRLLAKLLGLLKPGGFGLVQLTHANQIGHLSNECADPDGLVYEFYRRQGGIIHRLVKDTSGRGHQIMQMHHYSLDEVFCLLAFHGIHHVFCQHTNDAGVLGVKMVFRKNPS
jgi:SAM-dependent methyltransferase